MPSQGCAATNCWRAVPADRDRCFKLLGSQLVRNRDADGILHGHVALYGEGTASDELFQAAKTLADREGVVLNSHLGFDLDLANAMEQRWRRPRFLHLVELGVLGPNTTFVHMNLIRDGEIDPIQSSGFTIVWCPVAHMTRGIAMRERPGSPRCYDAACQSHSAPTQRAKVLRATPAFLHCIWPARCDG